MKYLEPEMSIILFDESVCTDDFLVSSPAGGNNGDGDTGEDSFTPMYL